MVFMEPILHQKKEDNFSWQLLETINQENQTKTPFGNYHCAAKNTFSISGASSFFFSFKHLLSLVFLFVLFDMLSCYGKKAIS